MVKPAVFNPTDALRPLNQFMWTKAATAAAIGRDVDVLDGGDGGIDSAVLSLTLPRAHSNSTPSDRHAEALSWIHHEAWIQTNKQSRLVGTPIPTSSVDMFRAPGVKVDRRALPTWHDEVGGDLKDSASGRKEYGCSVLMSVFKAGKRPCVTLLDFATWAKMARTQAAVAQSLLRYRCSCLYNEDGDLHREGVSLDTLVAQTVAALEKESL